MKMKISSFFTAIGALIVIALIITLFCTYSDLPKLQDDPEPSAEPSGVPVVNDLGEIVYCSCANYNYIESWSM